MSYGQEDEYQDEARPSWDDDDDEADEYPEPNLDYTITEEEIERDLAEQEQEIHEDVNTQP